VERFLSTLKLKRVYHQRYRTREQATWDVLEWIKIPHIRERPHLSLGYRSPAQFENLAHVA
jgi:putative transposase